MLLVAGLFLCERAVLPDTSIEATFGSGPPVSKTTSISSFSITCWMGAASAVATLVAAAGIALEAGLGFLVLTSLALGGDEALMTAAAALTNSGERMTGAALIADFCSDKTGGLSAGGFLSATGDAAFASGAIGSAGATSTSAADSFELLT